MGAAWFDTSLSSLSFLSAILSIQLLRKLNALHMCVLAAPSESGTQVCEGTNVHPRFSHLYNLSARILSVKFQRRDHGYPWDGGESMPGRVEAPMHNARDVASAL